ncbi:unnamed protein product, partial [Discosporangium mesarthrocarpum]
HGVVWEQVADEAIGHKAGDLILRIDTIPHPDFTRIGVNLELNMEIDLVDALTGFKTSFEHLDGHEVVVERTGVTPPGEVMTLEGEGMPRRSDRGKTFGVMNIKFTVIFPKVRDHR